MNSTVLKLIVEKKYFVLIEGITPKGAKSTIISGEVPEIGEVFIQGMVIFTAYMVSSITFHEMGCTITLKK